MTASTDQRAAAALVLGGVLAGGNAVGVRFTNRELEPLFGAGLRFLVAAGLLALVVVALRLPWPHGQALVGVVVFGLLNFAGAFGLAYYALVHLHAGLTSTLLALVPLVTLVLAVAHGQETSTRAGIVGGGVALLGVAVLTGLTLPDDVPVLAVLSALGSVGCFAEAAVLTRHFPRVHPVVMNTTAMAVGGAVLLAASFVAGEHWRAPREAESWVALAYLVLVGSIGVFLLFLYVLQLWAASRAAYFDVLIPPVAVLLSAWLDDESITWTLLLGGALVLLGAWVGALRPGHALRPD